jgi:hypothetical protein
MVRLSSGTVTFLFTHFQGSRRLWEQHAQAVADALASHDALFRDAAGAEGCWVVRHGRLSVRGV